MLEVDDIVEGVYLKQVKERSFWPYGLPGGIAVVQKVGTDWTGGWMFQLKYLNQPEGRTKAVQWGLTLREKDLGDFELIGNWLTAQALLDDPSTGKGLRVRHLARRPARLPAWRRVHPNQLRLFDEF
jgi:hypothetical protein